MFAKFPEFFNKFLMSYEITLSAIPHYFYVNLVILSCERFFSLLTIIIIESTRIW